MNIALCDLINKGLVKIEWNSEQQDWIFSLTDKGLQAFKEIEVNKELGIVTVPWIGEENA